MGRMARDATQIQSIDAEGIGRPEAGPDVLAASKVVQHQTKGQAWHLPKGLRGHAFASWRHQSMRRLKGILAWMGSPVSTMRRT